MTTQPSQPNDSVRTEISPAPSPTEGPVLSQWPFVERRRRTTDRRQESRALPLCGSDACTAREHQIVQLLMQGMTNKAIAQQLGIVEDTVKKHLTHIYDKLGVRRRALLMAGKRE